MKTFRRIFIYHGFWAPVLAVAILAILKMAAPYLNEITASIGLLVLVFAAAYGVLHVWIRAPAAKRGRHHHSDGDFHE